MQNNIKPLRANMREVVTTFEGEEMFIVPKKGGFGQEDNEGFVMVAGASQVSEAPTKSTFTPAPRPATPVASTPRPATTSTSSPRPATTTSTSTPRPASTPAPTPRPATTTSTSTPRPASTPAPAPRPATTTSTSTPRPTSSGTFESTTPRSTTTTPRPVSETTTPRSSTSTPSTTTPRSTTTPAPTTTPLPTIPNFNNLGRDDLHAQVISLGRLKLQTNVYSSSQIQTLTNAYNQALTLYNSKFGTNAPSPVTLPTFTNVATMSCDGLTAEITRIENIVRTTRFTSTAIADAYNRQLASAKTLKTSKCNVTPPTPNPTLPTFPNFATLSCDNLKAEISRISNIMQTSRFGSAQVTEAYTRALANAKQVLSTKCATPVPTPTPTPTPVPMPTPVPEVPKKNEEPPAPVGGGGGAIGGGGGGGGATDEGLGEQPTAEGEQPTAETEEQKPNYSWLWLLLIVGGIYMVTRKK